MSLLKPETSLMVGLATAAVVYSTYQHAVPTIADMRVGAPQNRDLDAARKAASWTAAGIVAAISLLAKDPTVFVIGGVMVVSLDWFTRHANEVNPMIGKATGAMGITGTPMSPAAPTLEAVANY